MDELTYTQAEAQPGITTPDPHLEMYVRYRDFAEPFTPSNHRKQEHPVLLLVRRGEMPRLEALVMQGDARLLSPIRTMPSGYALVTVACRDTATAERLRTEW